MVPHSSTLAWKSPWMEEPGRLQPMGSLRVGHDSATSLSLFTSMHWRRKWQPTPVFLPGESQGQRSLVGCRLWGRTESDTTEATQQQQHMQNIVWNNTKKKKKILPRFPNILFTRSQDTNLNIQSFLHQVIIITFSLFFVQYTRNP